MIRSLLLLFSTVILFACSTEERLPDSFEMSELEWILGNWELVTDDSAETGFEYWEKTKYGDLRGIGVSMEMEDTVFAEHLSIIAKDSMLFYVVDLPEASMPVLFQIREVSKDRFLCVNDSNEFPKKIEYIHRNDSMLVTISDSTRSFLFEFVGTVSE